MKYRFPPFSLLYCRSCRGERPHSQKGQHDVACSACGRTINVTEIVATYSADEYQDPAPILLPWRMLSPAEKARRMRFADDLTPMGDDAGHSHRGQLKPIDHAILRGEVKEEAIT